MNDPFIITFIIVLVPFTIARCYQFSLIGEIQRHSDLEKLKIRRFLHKISLSPFKRDLKKQLLDLCPEEKLVLAYFRTSRICWVTWVLSMVLLASLMIKK